MNYTPRKFYQFRKYNLIRKFEAVKEIKISPISAAGKKETSVSDCFQHLPFVVEINMKNMQRRFFTLPIGRINRILQDVFFWTHPRSFSIYCEIRIRHS